MLVLEHSSLSQAKLASLYLLPTLGLCKEIEPNKINYKAFMKPQEGVCGV
jgi:hypothetical protein